MGAGRETLDALLIEDNPGDARLVEHHLNAPEGFNIAGDITLHHEERLADGLDALDRDSHDVLFLDLGLPESTGLATLETVNEREPGVPIVVLTGLDDRETAINAIQSGAQDYLPKEDLNADLLARSVRYAVERHQQAVELRRQNERLDEFASVVSHDLRNPLNVAMGQVDLASRRGVDDDECLDTASAALDRMETLIDDLLTLARHGETVNEIEPVELASVARDRWRNVDTPTATLRIEAERIVRADQSRLGQLLANLFHNAVEHGSTSTGSRSSSAGGEYGDEGVTVTVGGLDDGFYVADDGSGVPESDREAVFKRGYTTAEEGTGFGLAIVEEIATAHGWNHTVTDGPDGGARFEFTGVESAE